MIIKFDKYINESLRDKMTPKSEQEVEDAIGDLVPRAKLEVAVENGVLSIVKKAVDEGADVKMLDKSIFGTACSKGYADVVKFLIDNGFDFHYRQEFALRSSVWSNKLDVVKILLEAGADVNADDKNAIGAAVENCILQNTPLDLIRTLLDYGATPKKRDYDFTKAWKKDKEKEPICDDILDIFNDYKPKGYKKINEGKEYKTPHEVVVEVANMNELMWIKEQIKKIKGIRFSYNEAMDTLELFPNWLIINLNWIEKDMYINYWSSDGEYDYNIEKIKMWMTDGRVDSNLYKINDLTMLIRKIKKYFDINDTPNYTPKKISRNLNEGVRDKMTPKSSNMIEDKLKTMTQEELNDQLVRAVTGNNIDVLKLVLPYVDLWDDDQELSLCELAIDLGYGGVLDLLLQKGIQLETKRELFSYIKSSSFHGSSYGNMLIGLIKKAKIVKK